jgi:hypothetical protein
VLKWKQRAETQLEEQTAELVQQRMQLELAFELRELSLRTTY